MQMVNLSIDLAPYRAAAVASIEAGAQNSRSKNITITGGQDHVYIHKGIEANAFLAMYPNSATALNTQDFVNWPFISNEKNITAPTMWQVAEIMSQLAAMWITGCLNIEQLRLSAKIAVNSANSQAAITAAANVIWP